MKGKDLASSKGHVVEEEEEKAADQLRGKVIPGDLIWARLGGLSWWPAQVVKEDAVSRSNKPDDRSEDEVLVRVYGSYNYLYVDPVKCCSEFEIILKQNNGSYREIFHKSLEQDLPSTKSSRSKGRGSKSKVPGKDFSKRTNVWKFKANDGNAWKFLAESTEEVESKTFKGNGVVKKLKLKGPSAKEVADCKTSKQDGVQKNEGNGAVKKLRLKGPSSKEEANCKTSKQNGVQKKSKPTSISSEEETKCESSQQSEVQKKHNPNISSTDAKMEAKSKTVKNAWLQEKLVPNRPSTRKEAKGKPPKQDAVQKKVESIEAQVQRNISVQDGVLQKRRPSSQCHEDAPESKTLKQDRSQKKLKLNSLSTEKEAKGETTKQDGMLKKLNSNTPCLATRSARKTCEKTSPMKSDVLNARRMRVMRNLGLTAPAGSPFDKNAHT